MFNNKKILIVAAHPDDEILGCGGSIAKWVRQGNHVDIVILAEVQHLVKWLGIEENLKKIYQF